MIRVTFICLGNICRSPMAELIFKDMIKKRGVADRFYVTSCGTSSYEIGNPVYPPARAMLASHGVSGSHTARKLTREDIEKSDYLLVMDGSNLRDVQRTAGAAAEGKLFLLLHFTGEEKEIDDPWYTRDFEKAYSDIVKGCESFLNYVLNETIASQ